MKKKAANQDIRHAIKRAGIFQYEVATALGINEVTFIRWLREPLTTAKRERVKAAICSLIQEATNDNTAE